MFREMRRKKQQLSEAECAEILNRNTSGVLAVSGDDYYPYAVPLSYVFDGNAVYFHCAKSGHKLDAITRNEKASFCVIDRDEIVPEKYTTHYRSVILFGRAKIITDRDEMLAAIEKLAIKYNPTDGKENRDAAVMKDLSALCIVKIDIDFMTGKEAIELVKNKMR